MRVKVDRTTVYTFDELSEEGKDAAVERYWDINVDYEWWDYLYEDAERIGLKITEFDIERNRYAKGTFTQSAECVARAIQQEHGEDCETYKTASEYLLKFEAVYRKTPDDEDLETEDIDRDFLDSLLEDYAIMLQKEFEYLTSREAIIETIRANEYEFTEDGKIG